MSCQGGLQSGLLPIPGAAPDTTGQSKNLPLALKIRRKYCFFDEVARCVRLALDPGHGAE